MTVSVTVNAAVSVDGKLSNYLRDQVELSGEEDWRRVDRLRAEADAVAVGVGTVIADDPSLTVKDESRATRQGQPTRVVLDSRGRTPTTASVFDGRGDVVVAVSGRADAGTVELLEDAGADVVRTEGELVDVTELLDALGERGVERLMVEGGGESIYSFFEADAVDHLQVYVASRVIGGRDAPSLVDGEGFTTPLDIELEDVERVDSGVLLEYTV